MAAIYVGNLHPAVTELMLLHRFSPAGRVRSVHVCKDRKSGSSLGYAYINYQRRADAERALDMFNLELLLDRPMRVMWSRHEAAVRISNRANIFLKNLDPSIDTFSVYDTFSVFGRIVSCKVVHDGAGDSGFGYVQFESAKAAELAIKHLDGKLLNDRPVTIERFKPREQRDVEARMKQEERLAQNNVETHTDPKQNSGQDLYLFVKNLDESVSDDGLRSAFSNFGTIQNTKVITENGRSRGFGFVLFSSPQEALTARKEMNGQMLGTKSLYVGVARRRPIPVQPPCPPENGGPKVALRPDSDPAVELAQPADVVCAQKPPSLDNVPAVEAAAAESAVFKTASAEASVASCTSEASRDKLTAPERLTSYMLESVPVDQQIQMAYGHMLPLVEKIHPTLANKMTWMLLEGVNNEEIMNLLADPEHLRARVDEMSAIIKAREAGLKPETLKMIFNSGNKTKKKKKGKNKRQN